MSILLVSTCKERLSEREFVHPISTLLGPIESQILHYSKCTSTTIKPFDKIIICGTSLKDNEYLENLTTFKETFQEFSKPILGICSGMQIVCSIFNGKIVQNVEIGMTDSETLEANQLCEGKIQAYNMHTNSVDNLDNFVILAKNKNSIQVIKHKTKKIFGVSFHPEVRNENIISNFIKI
tara:strand:+ start:2268 stop:2807 length:540 start_codon:yes stop_codon:yes gene_type:complete